MTIDKRKFRDCLGTFATGVTVVTAVHPDGSPVGVTANSFTSVSLDPPLILWNLARDSESFTRFDTATHFAVNILSAGQAHISRRFSIPRADRFEGIDWTPGPRGCPLIAGCVASLECRTFARHDGGDHEIIVGEVLNFTADGQPPLIFLRGRYLAAPDG